MSPAKAQPFGRRGRPAILAGSNHAAARIEPNQPNFAALPPDLVAALLRSPDQEHSAERPKARKVGWSLRAAVLAGLVVGLLNAAVNATSALELGGLLGQIPLGNAKLPFAVVLTAAGLWSGARASALALLFAHNFLNRRSRSTYLAYALAGGAASLAYALVVDALGLGAQHSLAVDVLSGLAAGFFYRLFAASEHHPQHGT
jgi:hypothetical protein